MLVREIMSTCIAECTEGTPLARVYEAMQTCGHRTVVVVESKFHRIPLGVVTEHSICEQVIGRGRKPQELLAANVMTSKIVKVNDACSIDLCPAVADHEPSIPLIVVDKNRDLCGLLPKEVLRVARAEAVSHLGTAPAAPAVDNSPLLGWTQ